MENERGNPMQGSPQVRPRRPEIQNNSQLRISDIFYAIKKHILLIVVLTAAGLAVGIVLSIASYLRGEMSKQYAIKASIAVTSQNENGLFIAQSTNPNQTDINVATEMVDAVMYVLKSDRTINLAVDNLQLLGVSTKDIISNLTMNQYNETQIVEMTLYWRSAHEGISILNAIMAVAPEVLNETLKIGNVSIINEPTSKYIIGGNINAAMWVYMAVLGAFAGAGIAMLELLLRPTLLSTKDMEKKFNLEVLGEIPFKKTYFKKKRNLLLANEDDAQNADVLDNYVSIAHILRNRFRDMEHPCVYITSAAQNEGKTTVTARVAVQLSEIGKRVLVIDFDTRNPRLGGMFLNKVEYAHSLNALYRGETSKEEAITHLNGSLDILPAVLERTPLPMDDAMLEMIRDLEQDYDIVLLDTAPVGQVADTMSLNLLADVAVLVVRFDGASLEVIRSALARLDKTGMPIIGCIVNGVKELGEAKFLKSSYGYGYGYGSGRYASATKPKKTGKTRQQKEWENWEQREQPTAPESGDKAENAEK